MSKKGTNDQQHIIDALIVGDYQYVWQQVKYIGYKTVSDIYVRNTVFWGAIAEFDPDLNNNFIKYYMDKLKFSAGYDNKTFYVSTNRAIINKLKNENISPTDCANSKITSELKNWSN